MKIEEAVATCEAAGLIVAVPSDEWETPVELRTRLKVTRQTLCRKLNDRRCPIRKVDVIRGPRRRIVYLRSNPALETWIQDIGKPRGRTFQTQSAQG